VNAICCAEFIISVFSLSDVLSVTHPISKKLQSVQSDFIDVATTVTDAISVMQNRRENF